MLRETLALPADDGFDLRLERTDVLSLVVRIPLNGTGTDALAVAARPGDVIGFGVETEEVDDGMFTRGERGGSGGPRGGPDGSPRGRRGGGFGRGGPQGPDPIDIWATLELASPVDDVVGKGDNEAS
jgi:hypothetical protein